ncbi:unnamed protein product [Brassica rapa subsp. trilocularis]
MRMLPSCRTLERSSSSHRHLWPKQWPSDRLSSMLWKLESYKSASSQTVRHLLLPSPRSVIRRISTESLGTSRYYPFVLTAFSFVSFRDL